MFGWSSVFNISNSANNALGYLFFDIIFMARSFWVCLHTAL